MLCYQLPTNVQALSDLYFAHNATFDGKLVWQKLPHDGEPMDFVTLNIGKYKGDCYGMSSDTRVASNDEICCTSAVVTMCHATVHPALLCSKCVRCQM